MWEIIISALISCFILCIVVIFVLPRTVDNHMERRVTEYVKETVINSETRVRDLITHQYEAEIKPIREALLGYKEVIEDLGKEIDDLYSMGQSQKRKGIDDMFDIEVKPSPK